MNIRPGRITLAKKLSLPTKDCSCTCVQVRLLHHLGIWSIISWVLSGGIDTRNSTVLIMIPMKVRHVVGLMSLSSAMGTFKEWNVDLKDCRSCCAWFEGAGGEANR